MPLVDRAVVQLSINDEYSTDSVEWRVLQEWALDLADIEADYVTFNLAAIAKGVGSVRIALGDTVLFTINSEAPDFSQIGASVVFLNPRALTLVKLAGQSWTEGQVLAVRGATLTFREAV